MMNLQISMLIILFHLADLNGQNVTHGPIVGGVTENSAVFVLRTDTAASVAVELSTSNTFVFPTYSTVFNTALDSAYFAKVVVTELEPETRYFYRAIVNESPVFEEKTRSFRTFPSPGAATNFLFHTGSGQQHGSDPNSSQGTIFPQMAAEMPAFMIHQGDWGYPDTTDSEKGLPGNYFSLDYNNIVSSYLARYDPNYLMSELLQITPVAYTYDDHDMINNNSDGVQYPWSGIQNSITGYMNMFPGYQLADSARGIWHKFTHGNTDIFMIDNRSQRTPNTGAFDFSNPDSVVFDPGPEHTILGTDQMNWLLQKLDNSTATWKFISSGTPIHPAWPITIELALLSQGIIDRLPVPGGGFITPVEIAIELADKWGGFPADMIRILKHIHLNQIENVIFLSGDTHTCGIDNGQNSILPELMAGGLDRTNGQLLRFFSLFGVEIWNSGGHTPDLPDEDFGNAYGRVTVFNNDSVALEAVAEGGVVLGRHVVHNGILPAGSGAAVAPLVGIDFGRIPAGNTEKQPFVIASISFDSLQVTDISIVGDTMFTVDFHSGQIAPGNKEIVNIYYSPIQAGDTSTADIQILTNDPDNALFTIPVRGMATQSTEIAAEDILPNRFALHQNYPNPFNPSTKISFNVEYSTDVVLEIFNILGQRIVQLIDGHRSPGYHEIQFDASKLPSGIYFYQLKAGPFTELRKMILLK